jgi:hypothetical protein
MFIVEVFPEERVPTWRLQPLRDGILEFFSIIARIVTLPKMT